MHGWLLRESVMGRASEWFTDSKVGTETKML